MYALSWIYVVTVEYLTLPIPQVVVDNFCAVTEIQESGIWSQQGLVLHALKLFFLGCITRSMKTTSCLRYIRNYSKQLYGDYSKPLSGSISGFQIREQYPASGCIVSISDDNTLMEKSFTRSGGISPVTPSGPGPPSQ